MASILIDIDNTLVETARFRMTLESARLWDKLEKLRKDEGVELIGFTSRPRFLKTLTAWQLSRLGIRFDDLIMGKPRADVYLGNRAVNFDCRTGNYEVAFREIRRLITV